MTVEVTSRRYVAMLDILGFRDLVRNNSLFCVARKVELLLDKCDGVRKASYLPIGEGEIGELLEFGSIHFSDTVILWSPPVRAFPDKHAEYVGGCFVAAIATAIYHGLLNDLPIRVGIAFGEVYLDQERKILLGQPIVDAHLAESSQNWIGGALHSSCLLETHLEPQNLLCAVEYPVPVKQGCSNPPAAVDWTVLPRLALHVKAPGSQWKPQSLLNPYIERAKSPEVAMKYANARNFAESRNIPLSTEEL